MIAVSSGEIAAWDDLILALANKRSRINGVDKDDLIQEGRTSVFLCLKGGITPSELDIKNSMRRWINAQKKNSSVQYEIRS